MNFRLESFPPKNFEQLRQLVIKLKQGDSGLKVGKKSLLALDCMIQDPSVVATSNIVELAKVVKLSSASLTRLAKLLGFHGFNQFQNLFKQKSKITDNFYSDSLDALLNEQQKSVKEIIQKQLQQLFSCVEHSIGDIDEDHLHQAVSLLAHKHRIFIFGYRQSSAIASILRYGLALIRPNVQMLVQADHGVAIALGQLKKGDLLVVIGSAPYSNVTIKIAALAKKQHCQLISITDSTLSPLNDLAEVSLNIPTSGHFYANSLVANCFFVESLLSLTAMELGTTAIDNLKQHEQLLADLEVSG